MPDSKILLGQRTSTEPQVGPYWKYATFTHQLLQNTKMALGACEQRARAYKLTETRQRKIIVLKCQVVVLNKTISAMESATSRCVTSICRTFFEKNISRLRGEVNKKEVELKQLTTTSAPGITDVPEEF